MWNWERWRPRWGEAAENKASIIVVPAAAQEQTQWALLSWPGTTMTVPGPQQTIGPGFCLQHRHIVPLDSQTHADALFELKSPRHCLANYSSRWRNYCKSAGCVTLAASAGRQVPKLSLIIFNNGENLFFSPLDGTSKIQKFAISVRGLKKYLSLQFSFKLLY